MTSPRQDAAPDQRATWALEAYARTLSALIHGHDVGGLMQSVCDSVVDRDVYALALVGFAAFMIWELTERNPIVNLKVFRHRGFSTSMITLALVMGAFFATNVLTPLWLQSNMGYTATWAGYITGMIGVLAIVSAPITAQAMTRTDPRRILFAGVCWLAVTTFMRSHGLSPGQVGLWLGLSSGAAGVFGTWLGGALADRFGARNPRHLLTAPIIGMSISFPFLLLAYSVPDWRLSMLLICGPAVFNSLSYGPVFAILQGVIQPKSRALAVAVIRALYPRLTPAEAADIIVPHHRDWPGAEPQADPARPGPDYPETADGSNPSAGWAADYRRPQ